MKVSTLWKPASLSSAIRSSTSGKFSDRVLAALGTTGAHQKPSTCCRASAC